MFHPLQSLFRHTRLGWDDVDIKYYVQEYLKRQLKSDALYCDKVHKGIVVVRVNSAAARQEVSLLEFDLARELKKHATYTLRQLIVHISG